MEAFALLQSYGGGGGGGGGGKLRNLLVLVCAVKGGTQIRIYGPNLLARTSHLPSRIRFNNVYSCKTSSRLIVSDRICKFWPVWNRWQGAAVFHMGEAWKQEGIRVKYRTRIPWAVQRRVQAVEIPASRGFATTTVASGGQLCFVEVSGTRELLLLYLRFKECTHS